jgi:hypothetical protein
VACFRCPLYEPHGYSYRRRREATVFDKPCKQVNEETGKPNLGGSYVDVARTRTCGSLGEPTQACMTVFGTTGETWNHGLWTRRCEERSEI